MYSGAGYDTFVWDAATQSGMDTIMDYASNFDTLDVSQLIDFSYGAGDIESDFMRFTVSGSHTRVQVDRDGTGSTYTWDNVVQLQNVTGLNFANQVNNGMIIFEV
jgi:hypothetical protein